MSEKTTETGAVESETYFEELSSATIRAIYKPPSPEYNSNDEAPEVTGKKDRKRKQDENPRPVTRSRKGELEKEKEKEGEKEREGATQTDPSRAIQTEPGPSRVPLSPGVRVKRARTEIERPDPKMIHNITHLVTTCNKILDTVTAIKDAIQDQGSRIGVLETRVRTLQEARRDTAVQALELREPTQHTQTPHVEPRREGGTGFGIF